MKTTNFDLYLGEQLRDPEFARRFHAAGDAWDVSLQIVRLRENAGLTQKQLAERLHTTQQQISRIESASYKGHSLSMLRRVASALDAKLSVTLEPAATSSMASRVAEHPAPYRAKKKH